MAKKITYINLTIKEINDLTDEIYESFFESDEEIKECISKLILLLNEILTDLKDEQI